MIFSISAERSMSLLFGSYQFSSEQEKQERVSIMSSLYIVVGGYYGQGRFFSSIKLIFHCVSLGIDHPEASYTQCKYKQDQLVLQCKRKTIKQNSLIFK
jgi:hypothetical protein